jgi:dienelactone hydrolase
MAVLELARSGADLAAVVSVHGSLQPAQLVAQSHSAPNVFNHGVKYRCQNGQIRAAILVCHGALDPHVPMAQVVEFTEEMAQAKADWQLLIYGNALHGFTHDTPSGTPGVAYDAQADARSSAHIRAFLADVFAE